MTVFGSVRNAIILCEMMMEGREKMKPGAGSYAALLEKHQGGSQALTSTSDGRIAINSTICLSTYVLRKCLEFNPGLRCTI